MVMTYAAVTGRITIPGTELGIRAKVTAVPMSTDHALAFADRVTWGPRTVETDASGNMPSGGSALKIPQDSTLGDELLWKITAEPIDRLPALARKWTIAIQPITADITIQTLVTIDLTMVSAELATTVGENAAAAAASETAAEGWADAAADSAADSDTSADQADISEANAATSATTASTAAGTATTKAGEASTSATAAAGSATSAASSATGASTSATAAAGSATAAAGSATAAGTSATNAASSATAANAAKVAAEAVGSTNDTIIAGRINDPASATTSALTTSIDARVPTASTAAQGKVELATSSEATTGTDTARAVTPAGVKAANAENSVGRVTPTKHAPALGLYFPEAEGAVGDGTTDDTAAVAAAFAAASAAKKAGAAAGIYEPGGTVSLQGSYKLTSLAAPIVAICNIDGEHATLLVPDAYAGAVLLVGHDTSGSILMNAQIKAPSITKSTSASIVASSVGIQVQNVYNSEIALRRTAYFETGAWFTGYGNGTSYNRIHIGYISTCKISVALKPRTGGWVNQNTFVGGGIQQSPSAFGGGLRRSGWYHLLLDGAGINHVTGNTFLGVSFEGDVSEHTFHIANAYNNQFFGCRHEQGTASTSVAVSGGGSATLTTVGHGLAVDDMVVFGASSSPTGMQTGSPYFVIAVPTTDTFTVAQVKGGTAATFSSAGTSVVFYRPQRIYFDQSGTCFSNVIANPFITPNVGSLDLVQTSSGGGANVVKYADGRETFDGYYTDDLPPHRFRNKNAQTGSRPGWAAYPATVDPSTDPKGWTAALAETGPVFAASRAETGRVKNSGGVLQYRRPADSVDYELVSYRRTQSGVTLAGGTTYNAGTRTSGTTSLTGASVGDYVHVADNSAQLIPFGLRITAKITASGTITYAIDNLTGSNITTVADIVLYFAVGRRFF